MKNLLAFALFLIPTIHASETHIGKGLLSGEPTHDSIILQTRLTFSPHPIDGILSGLTGVGRFEISSSSDFKKSIFSEWLTATPENDYILKTKITSLKPSTTYHYRIIHGLKESVTKSSTTATFHTLPSPEEIKPVSFILTSCLNYAFFHHGDKQNPAANANDRALGYPALDQIANLKPDFVIFNGDCVYYDHPWDTRAKTQEELRQKWHEQYSMPRFVKLFSQTPTYWLKDDHDHRFNDSDTSGDQAPSNQLGIATFREQLPIIDPKTPDSPTYRTHRMGKDLQLWFMEGRDYRSDNNLPDGPEKSLWGKQQRRWLEQTIKESDATYKIIITPTPMIGPDDGHKSDNHANLKGFHHEAQSFFQWLTKNKIDPKSFFILCGDRHWKYQSTHPLGFTEFCCGALNKENARLGRIPGDPKSNDPEAKIQQAYTDKTPSGGFLKVDLQPDSPATLKISLHDDSGKILHQFKSP